MPDKSLIIIGAGPAGYETAVEAAKRGLKVTLVSEGPLGGTCLNEGCIPTKTFVSMCGKHTQSEILARKTEVVSKLQAGIASLLKQVEIVSGRASFVGPSEIEVGGQRYSADAIIVATGSVNASLPIPGAELCLDSTSMLVLEEVPGRLCIIGGGVIGLEFASIYAAQGSEVTVLEYCPGILPRFDLDLAKRLKASLSRRGVNIVTSAKVCAVGEGYVEYEFKDNVCRCEADVILMAVGRRPAVDGLNLEVAGIDYDRKGIKVDADFRTSNPVVYAVGDVNGGIMLAHVATFEGLKALDSICGQSNFTDFSVVPAAVFTEPELATVGLTEEDCQSRGIEYRALKAFYRANGKAVAMGEEDGYCKILVETSTGRILGGHILGAHSSDLIHEITTLVAFGVTVPKAKAVIHAHPSLSEVILSALRTW